MLRLDPTEFQARMQRVEKALESAGLDALIGYSVGNQPGSAAYLSGYEPRFGVNDVAYFVLVPGANPTYALLGNAYWDEPATRTWVKDVTVTSNFVPEILARLPSTVKRVGIAGYTFFPTPIFRALQAVLPETSFEDATELLKNVAKIKTPAEIELIRRAAEISDLGAQVFLDHVKSGENERVLQMRVDSAIIGAGADGLAFPTFIMTGPRVAVSIGFSEDRELVTGEQANVLCGAQVGGYRVELGRVTTVGEPSARLAEIMDTAAEMHEAMLVTVKAGTTAGEVAQASVAAARKHQMDNYLFKSMNNSAAQGHGMGCWVNEPPPIHPGEATVLQENMTLSLESRLCLPGIGGAVITEMVLVTPSGCERFSKLPIATW